MAERPKVPRRPMTHEERLRALHLAALRYAPGTWSKRFAREVGARVGTDNATITDREAKAMERLAWTFRRQLQKKGLGRFVPASKPPPAQPRATAQPRSERRKTRTVEDDLQAALDLAGGDR